MSCIQQQKIYIEVELAEARRILWFFIFFSFCIICPFFIFFLFESENAQQRENSKRKLCYTAHIRKLENFEEKNIKFIAKFCYTFLAFSLRFVQVKEISIPTQFLASMYKFCCSRIFVFDSSFTFSRFNNFHKFFLFVNKVVPVLFFCFKLQKQFPRNTHQSTKPKRYERRQKSDWRLKIPIVCKRPTTNIMKMLSGNE